MADTKISALPASTTPLAGTEVLPIVQSSSTKQVSVANLTAGRSFDALAMTLTSTDAGAAAAPTLDLYRDSASPAASDTLGEIEFNGEDSAGNKQAYALFHASILSPTSGAEQGQLHFETVTAGALTEKMIIGTTNLVINEIGAVFNVRIEGDTDANLLYTDATNDRVGVGTLSPSVKFEVNGAAKASSLALTTPLPITSGGTNSSIIATFSATQNVAQALSASTLTLIQFQNEEFDTNSYFNNTNGTVGSALAYSFNPQTAGYYQLNACISAEASFTGGQISFYKNGTIFKRGINLTTAVGGAFTAAAIIYFNGTTDCVQVYGAFVVPQNTSASVSDTWFQGSFLRSA